MKNKKLPDLGDPLTQLYYDLIHVVGCVAAKHPNDLDEDRIWLLVRKMDVIYQQHMRQILEEAEDIAGSEHRSDIHPGAQAIIDRLLRENGQ
ncbi:MAG: hypothetical protein ISR95_02510 [Candidatus Marinimicrobia bacterium]|nr:hypothetical protein [Candidatus Neomarinimicrobiota bacterium]